MEQANQFIQPEESVILPAHEEEAVVLTAEQHDFVYNCQNNDVHLLVAFLNDLRERHVLDRSGRVLSGYTITFEVDSNCTQEILFHITRFARINIARRLVCMRTMHPQISSQENVVCP
jgi:hypothetical protein